MRNLAALGIITAELCQKLLHGLDVDVNKIKGCRAKGGSAMKLNWPYVTLVHKLELKGYHKLCNDVIDLKLDLNTQEHMNSV